LRLEWGLPDYKLVGEDAKTPDINPVVVICLMSCRDHFRRQIIWGATKRVSSHGWGMHRPTEISEFDHATAVKKILRF
jgi:hypothetical protein